MHLRRNLGGWLVSVSELWCVHYLTPFPEKCNLGFLDVRGLTSTTPVGRKVREHASHNPDAKFWWPRIWSAFAGRFSTVLWGRDFWVPLVCVLVTPECTQDFEGSRSDGLVEYEAFGVDGD